MATNRIAMADSELERRLDREFDNVEDDDLERAIEERDSELDDKRVEGRFARRLFELTQAHEAGRDVDGELDRVLEEMERQYFFGGLGKKLKRAGARLIKKGMKVAKGAGAAALTQAMTGLARGNAKGLLKAIANTGITAGLSGIPGGALAAPMVTQALGFETDEEGWQTFTDVARETYDHLARNLTEDSDQPAEAARVAVAALEAGLERAGLGGRRESTSSERRIVLRPGQRLILEA